MKDRNFKYGNNGQYCFRYVASRGRSFRENSYNIYDYDKNEISTICTNENSLKNLTRGFRSGTVSEATRKKIAKYCRVLGIASEKRTVRNGKGEYIKFLTSFITLTLPSDQRHDDSFITKEILGVFLDKCRKLGMLQNYVWRAEKQKNGNIHYHILTDTFASFSFFKRIWHLACEKHGYISAYQNRFSSMAFETYRQQKFNAKRSASAVASAYATGQRTNWTNPPSLDIAHLDDISAVSKYVAKYISKNADGSDNIVNGRSWGASQSVTLAVKNFTGDNTISQFWYNVSTSVFTRKIITTDFFSMPIFSFNSLISWYGDVFTEVKKMLSGIFVPCQYWRNSVGLYTIS